MSTRIEAVTNVCLNFNHKARLHNIKIKGQLEYAEKDIFKRRSKFIRDSHHKELSSLSKFDKELKKAEQAYFKNLIPLWRKRPGFKDGVFVVTLSNGAISEASYYGYRNPPVIKVLGDDTLYYADNSPVLYWKERIGDPKILPYNYHPIYSER